MAEAPPTKKRRGWTWRANVSHESRQTHMSAIVHAICASFGSNARTRMEASTDEGRLIEAEFFHEATSLHDYETRVDNFVRSMPVAPQAPGKSSAEIRDLEPQHVAESSSDAAPAMGDVEHVNALRKAFERYVTATSAMEEEIVPLDLFQQSKLEKSKRDSDVVLREVDELIKAIVAGAKKAKHLSSFVRTKMRESGIVEETTFSEAVRQQMKAMKKNQSIVLALEAQPSSSSSSSSSSSRQDTSAAADVRAMPPPKMKLNHGATSTAQMDSGRSPPPRHK